MIDAKWEELIGGLQIEKYTRTVNAYTEMYEWNFSLEVIIHCSLQGCLCRGWPPSGTYGTQNTCPARSQVPICVHQFIAPWSSLFNVIRQYYCFNTSILFLWMWVCVCVSDYSMGWIQMMISQSVVSSASLFLLLLLFVCCFIHNILYI